MKDFRNLLVWEKAHSLTLGIYNVTKSFPPDERFGLTSQMRRSTSSIPTNIAEGCGRGTDADFQRFLQIAYGSASEVDYQIILAGDLEYISADVQKELDIKAAEIKRMLASLIRKVPSQS